jgi:hypothetical protein
MTARLLARWALPAALLATTAWLSPAPHGSVVRNDFRWKSVRQQCLTLNTAGEVRLVSGRYELNPANVNVCDVIVTWELKPEFQNTDYGNALMDRADDYGVAVVMAGPQGSQALTARGTPTRQGWQVSFNLRGVPGPDLTLPYDVAIAVSYDDQTVVYADPAQRSFVALKPRRVGPLTRIGGGAAAGGTPSYGWETAVTNATIGNLGLAIGTRLGSAEDAIAGNTLRAIITDPNVKVRGDNQSCQACHGNASVGGWAHAENATRESFCELVDDFDAAPSKPQILKALFNNWGQRNCPN